MKRIITLLLVIYLLTGCSKPAEEAAKPDLPETQAKELSYKTVLKELKNELGNDYIVEYLRPFVVAGNLSRSQFDRFKNGTIKNCSQAMYKDYFDKKPDYILKVYLFKDAQTYEDYCVKKEGREPTTPYGFYQPYDKTLVMNIGTGGGTLVHEMFHALVEPDFPDIPAWFNEGMGSLYEQCTVTDNGSLKGLINWRYPVLMQAHNQNRLGHLEDLFNTTGEEFYDKDSGSNYAQARYFCLYMQENKVLTKFYKKFRDNFSQDNTGIKFMEELLGKTIDQIDSDWLKWIPKIKNIYSLR